MRPWEGMEPCCGETELAELRSVAREQGCTVHHGNPAKWWFWDLELDRPLRRMSGELAAYCDNCRVNYRGGKLLSIDTSFEEVQIWLTLSS
jgi:hypothetical protein